MSRTTVVAIVVAVGLGVGGAVLPTVAASADTPRFVTTFRFEVKFGDGTTTYDQDRATNVWFPRDVAWQCIRNATAIVDGRRRGSFVCSADDWRTTVLTMVGCRIDQDDPERTAAMRITYPPPGVAADAGAVDGGAPARTFLDLTVSCKTTRAP